MEYINEKDTNDKSCSIDGNIEKNSINPRIPEHLRISMLKHQTMYQSRTYDPILAAVMSPWDLHDYLIYLTARPGSYEKK